MSLDPSASTPLNGLKKLSVKFQGQTPATTDPNTGAQTPASGPDHGLAEISLESHAPEKGMSKVGAPDPQQFGGGTKLDPLSEALFPHWMRANGVDPDGIADHTFDYRGTYQQTGGQVHPPGTLSGMAAKINQIHAGRSPETQGMLDLMKPVSSHGGGQLTSPGTPSYGQALQGKADTLSGMGADPNSDPLRELMNLIQRQGGQ